MPLSVEERGEFRKSEVQNFVLSLAILVDQFLTIFLIEGVLNYEDWQVIKAEVTAQHQIIKLWIILTAKLNSLQEFKEIAEKHGGDFSEILELTQLIFKDSDKETNVISQQNPLANIRRYYERNFKYIWPFQGITQLKFEIDSVNVNLELNENMITDNYLSCLLTALSESNTVFIHGEPGSGKSTVAKLICYHWAIGKLDSFDLVLFARLREVKDCETILDAVYSWMLDKVISTDHVSFLEHQTMTDHETTDSSDNQLRTLVILDGLDELSAKCSQLQFLLDQDFLPELPYNLVILGRPEAFKKVYCQAPSIKISGFDRSQQEQYILHHFQHSKVKCTEAVNEKLNGSPELQRIAHSPLLLTYMCLVFDKLVSNTVTELIMAICNYLIRRYERLNKFHSSPFGEKWLESEIINSLCHLAFDGLVCNQTGVDKVFFTWEDLQKHRVSPLCLEVGFIVVDEQFDVATTESITYSFHHNTLQQFFCSLLVHRQLGRVPHLDPLIAKTAVARHVELYPHSMENTDVSEYYRHVDTKALDNSNVLRVVFDHQSSTPLPTQVWNFVLELAVDSEDGKTIHNTVVFWLSRVNPSNRKVGIDFALLLALHSLVEDQAARFVLNCQILFQIQEKRTFTRKQFFTVRDLIQTLSSSIPGKLAIVKSDEYEFSIKDITLLIYTDQYLPAVDWTDNFKRACGMPMEEFNRAFVSSSSLSRFLRASDVITKIGTLNLQVCRSMNFTTDQSKHWRSIVPKFPKDLLERLPENDTTGREEAFDYLGLPKPLQDIVADPSIRFDSFGHPFVPEVVARGKYCTIPELIIDFDREDDMSNNEIEVGPVLLALTEKAVFSEIILTGSQPTVISDIDRVMLNPAFNKAVFTTLNFRNIVLSSANVRTLEKIFSQWTNLTEFGLCDSSIKSYDLLSLVMTIRTCSEKKSCQLNKLRVKERCLKECFSQFCLRLYGWKELKVLLLSENGLSRKDMNFIRQAVDHLPGLKSISLIGNKVTDSQVEMLKGKGRFDVYVG